MSKFINLISQRFGFWKVIEIAKKGKNSQTKWICQCDCGTIKSVTANSLRTGNSTSCGCNHSPVLDGKIFGNLTVLKSDYSKNGKKWKCECNCGNEIIVNTYNLNNGNVTSCGCIKKIIH